METNDKIKLLKSQGHSDSTIAIMCGVTAGNVQRITMSPVMRMHKYTRREGHFRPNPFGNQEPLSKLAKSSVPNDEPVLIQKARELLALQFSPDDVCEKLRITRMEMSKWLSRHWGV